MAGHDPTRFVADLGAKLATRSRHVCVFLGAGAARACGLPDVALLQERVLGALPKGDAAAFKKELEGRNLEGALSRLRRIVSLLDDKQEIDGLTAPAAGALDAAVCQQIVRELDLSHAELGPMIGLAAWVARADYRLPVELFTVNYDLLIETALEILRVPYFDGFVGSLRSRFHTELVEALPGVDSHIVPAFFCRLWKLHGSVNWAWEEREVVRLGRPVTDGLAAAIYPSDAKYDESRRVPFVVLQDRFRRALHQPETLVLISGYSFSDDHLNELIFEAAERYERSEFVAFCHSSIPEVVADRATRIPNVQAVGAEEAILGGARLDWSPPTDAPADVWADERFLLGDFTQLGKFLARSATREPQGDLVLQQLLERVNAASAPPVDVDE